MQYSAQTIHELDTEKSLLKITNCLPPQLCNISNILLLHLSYVYVFALASSYQPFSVRVILLRGWTAIHNRQITLFQLQVNPWVFSSRTQAENLMITRIP